MEAWYWEVRSYRGHLSELVAAISEGNDPAVAKAAAYEIAGYECIKVTRVNRNQESTNLVSGDRPAWDS